MKIPNINLFKNYTKLTKVNNANMRPASVKRTADQIGTTRTVDYGRQISQNLSSNIFSFKYNVIPFFFKGTDVLLTERTAANSAISTDIIRKIPGYTDESGNILPYLYIDGLSVRDKGQGIGRQVMEKIINLAKEKYGGRLLLKPENKNCNPSVFYYKCGLLSTTKKGAKEIQDFIEHGIPFHCGYSDAMYLPI